MKPDEKMLKTILKTRRYSLVFSTVVAFLMVCTAGVSTFAWFQANAAASVTTTSEEATITVARPEDATFYYFTGNGTPGSSYTGYSASNSNIGKAQLTFTHDGSTDPSNVGFDSTEGKAYYFAKIDGESNRTFANCFNLSKIRPGCYYTFCVSYVGQYTGLELTFADSVTGNNKSPKRMISYGTPYYASLGLALNGWCSTAQTKGYAATFIKDAFNGGATSSGNDKIVYPNSNTLSPFVFADDVDTRTANTSYIYFSIFMGFNDKSDAIAYSSKTGTGASEVITYTRGTTSGDYSALDGLSMTLSKIEVTYAQTS